MIKHGKRFAPRRKRIKSAQTDPFHGSRGDTRRFSLSPRRRNASYFFFTLLACLLLAGFAMAVLSVDYFGRAMSDGADPTFAFNVTQDGQAQLSFLGRDYSADVSFLAPVKEFFSKGTAAAEETVPKSLRLVFKSVPQFYDTAASAVARVEEYITELISELL